MSAATSSFCFGLKAIHDDTVYLSCDWKRKIITIETSFSFDYLFWVACGCGSFGQTTKA